MRTAREQAIARLDVPVPAPAPARGADSQRLVERVLEMVQDAIRKGERVGAASERASSVTERLARRLDGSALDAEALVVRLAPVGEAPPATLELAPPTPELRLVDPADGPDDGNGGMIDF